MTTTSGGGSLRARFMAVAAVSLAATLLLTHSLESLTLATAALSVRAAIAFAAIVLLALTGVASSHPYPVIGYANWVTTFRAALVAAVAALMFEPVAAQTAWVIVVVASVAASFDSVDGWLARRTGMQSPFGARFDMEIDALLILLLSLLVWRLGKAGSWIVLSGALRYLFIAAGWLLPWMNAALPDSMRRKAVCVVQIVSLIVAIGPIIPVPLSAAIAAISLALLVWSFAVDVLWLRNARSTRAGGRAFPSSSAGSEGSTLTPGSRSESAR